MVVEKLGREVFPLKPQWERRPSVSLSTNACSNNSVLKDYKRDKKIAQNGPLKNSLKKHSAGITSSTVNSTPGLTDIHRLTGLEELRSELQSVKESLRKDLWGADVREQKIEYVTQQAEDTVQNIEAIYEENKNLHREVDLLKAIVIKLDRKVSEQDREIIDLKSRSMRDNILIHRFKESPNQNLMLDIPSAIKKVYGEDLKFVRIHRIGPPRRGPVPRTIVGKLEHYDKKEEILQIQRDFRRSSKETPFDLTEQFPAALVEERKHLFKLQHKYTSQNVETCVRGNKLVFKNNGNVYREKVFVPRAEDVLHCDEDE